MTIGRFPCPPRSPRAVRPTSHPSVARTSLLAQATWRALGCAAVVVGCAQANGAERTNPDAGAVFDNALLKERGIDPAVAAYFREAPRFRAGQQRVALVVNGIPKGRAQVQFNDQGELCVGAALLEQAGLRGTGDTAEGNACPRFTDAYPSATLKLLPGKEQIELIIAADQLLDAQVRRDYANGGVAGLFNYDVLTLNGRHANGGSSRYLGFNSELGVNAGGWAFRSRQSYTATEHTKRLEHLYAYASRTLEQHGANVQLGQLNMASPLFSVGAFSGVQVLPETALTQAGLGTGSLVQGIAHSPSRVEVRQNGAVIFTTVVPTGPFALADLPLLNRKLDLEVTVREESGGQQRFTVPASSLREASLDVAPGFAIAAGQVRRFGGDDRDTPYFVSASKDWQWRRHTRVTVGALAGSGYQSAGWALQQSLGEATTLNAQQLVSSTARQSTGTQFQIGLSTAFASQWSASVSARTQTESFRTLADTTWDHHLELPEQRSRYEANASLGWATPWLGSLSGAYSRQAAFDGTQRARGSLAWSRAFGRANVSLSYESDIGSNDGHRSGDATYLTVSVPLGRNRRARAYASDDDRGLRSGVRVNEQVTDTLGYTASVERHDSGQVDVGARLNLLPRYTRVDAGYQHRDDGSSSYDVALRGGLVVHREGVTFSPYPVRDTFAVLKVGDQAGVKLKTSAGPVWTDAGGRAVVPQLQPYRISRLEVDTASLARNVDISNGYKEIAAGRGSVHHLDFDIVTVRRLLLTARTADGQPLPKGVAVYDDNNTYITTVLDGGKTFLTDSQPEAALHAVLEQGQRCRLDFDVAAKPDANALYEAADAVCRLP